MFPRTLKIKNTGFSLVELVIVIAVLAILSAASIPAFMHITKWAKVVNAKSNLILIIRECMTHRALTGDANPTFADIPLGKTLNSYGDSYGIAFGEYDGFTYDTTISSGMPTRINSSCLRVAAKSNSTNGLGQTYYFPHFEIYYDTNLEKIQKNCVTQAGAYNRGNLCNTSKPYGQQW